MNYMQILESEVIPFWLGDAVESTEALKTQAQRWFVSDETFDREIRQKFGYLFDVPSLRIASCYANPKALLAGVILFDQFSRNCFRGQAQAFAFDSVALSLLDYGLTKAWDQALHVIEASFLFMPLQHAESIERQNQSILCYSDLLARAPQECKDVIAGTLSYAKEHRDVISQFGRFPHRNQVLGRSATVDEEDYLTAGGKRYGQ